MISLSLHVDGDTKVSVPRDPTNSSTGYFSYLDFGEPGQRVSVFIGNASAARKIAEAFRMAAEQLDAVNAQPKGGASE